MDTFSVTLLQLWTTGWVFSLSHSCCQSSATVSNY